MILIMNIADWPNGMKFIQSDSQFKLTTDSVLLAHFAANFRARKICEPCCGIGGIAILLAGRLSQSEITCIELQDEAVRLAKENVNINGFSSRINVIHGDLRNYYLLPADTYDLVVCNPPYFSVGTGKPSNFNSIQTARSDENCTIEDVCIMSSRILKTGGRLCIVWRAERLVDLLLSMRNNKLEPKRLRRVLDKTGQIPRIVLVEARKGAGISLKHEPDLIMRNDDGTYTKELLQIYGKGICDG